MAAFITVDDLTDVLGRDVTADNGAQIAVSAASDICRTVSEQSFTAGTSTVTLDGTGTPVLLLPESPVLNAGTVLVNGGTVTDYVVDTDRGRLVRKLDVAASDWWWDIDWSVLGTVRWPQGYQNVEVTFEHGYSDIPSDVKMVALNIAQRLVVQGPAVYETAGPDSVRYAGPAMDLSTTEKLVLHKYRQVHS